MQAITFLKLLLGHPGFQKIILISFLWFGSLFLLWLDGKRKERQEKWKRTGF